MGSKRRRSTAGEPRAPKGGRIEAAGQNSGWIQALGRSRFLYPLLSIVLLIPCFWQSRIQAGDLSSHIYNAWLAKLIAAGQAPGLIVVRQTTNVLFDLILSGLFARAGAEAAQRIAVSLAVLVFAWGSFAFVGAVSGRRAWHVLPMIGMLAYGWVFHMGFFSFYLSLGLCFWALAIAWEGAPRKLAIAAAIFGIAWLAHALPVAWSLGILSYWHIARRLDHRSRWFLAIGSITAIAVLRVALGSWMLTRWFPAQIYKAAGLDQVAVFDDKYGLAVAGLFAVWALGLTALLRESGFRHLVSSVVFQITLVTAIGIAVLPNAVLLPGYQHLLSFIADRMSLALAVCVCALLGKARPPVFQHYAMALAGVIFFAFLYRDEAIFNSVEDRMLRLVAQLPGTPRVISAIDASDLRVNALTHMIDRVCLERCYSYANYEPSTAQFRIRATGENPIVISAYVNSWEMQSGSYLAKERDLPLYEVNLDANQRLVMLSLLPGVPNGITRWNPL